ncbi:hypothetical protein F4780DRAFT_722373 [Xylariomycetidae sp. FL0641]|nr:hypothetical protein F4780DRAFT_722373 [Xylariomycetidae sp. FL0641]
MGMGMGMGATCVVCLSVCLSVCSCLSYFLCRSGGFRGYCFRGVDAVTAVSCLILLVGNASRIDSEEDCLLDLMKSTAYLSRIPRTCLSISYCLAKTWQAPAAGW